MERCWRGTCLCVLVLGCALGCGFGQTPSPSPACAATDAEARRDPSIRDLVAVVDRQVALDELDAALDTVKADLAAHPRDTRLEDALGRVMYRKNELAPAIDAFNAAIVADPCNGRAHYDAWRVNAMAGLYVAAQQQLDIAHTVYPTAELFQRMWRNTQMALPEGVVADNPPHFNFYARHYDCDGIPVRSANVVNPAALVAACGHIRQMLEHIPNVRANLIAKGAELHIMGEDQQISDLPEARNRRGEQVFPRVGDTAKSLEKVDIDAWAGATGGIYANCPEINLLHLPGDGYGVHDEVCVHEFAHDIMGIGFDAGMRLQIQSAYKASIKKGLWKGAYAATNPGEWWAEMSAWYFGAQGGVGKMEAPVPAPGPEALRAYDPAAFALLDRFYGGQKQPAVVKMHEMKPMKEVEGGTGPNPDLAEALFINNTPVRQYLDWVDRQGGSHSVGFVEPYNRLLYPCYMNQYWMVMDPRTKVYKLFTVSDPESQVTIN